MFSFNTCTHLKYKRFHLFREQLFAQSVQSDELPSKDPSVDKPFSDQHDFTDQLEVRHHHSTRSEGQSKDGTQRLYSTFT